MTLSPAQCRPGRPRRRPAGRRATRHWRASTARSRNGQDCRDGFECARVAVPLDYADPGGDTIEISVNRRPAGSGSKRIGSLLVNPGGPGASGLDFARPGSGIVSASLLERYDLVGFDPRGVGESTPVTCLSDAETDTYLAADGSPDTRAEEQRLVDLAKEFGERCAEGSGDLLGHVSTVEAARDIDVLRAVLGDERLNFLGKSYGTYLGATYAELFPDRVGRLVLDGALDPTLDQHRPQRGPGPRASRAPSPPSSTTACDGRAARCRTGGRGRWRPSSGCSTTSTAARSTRRGAGR